MSAVAIVLHMAEIQYREYRHEDSEGYNRVHDQEWKHIPEEFWHEWSRREDTTMSVALIEGRVVGGIPFHLRRFRIGDNASIEAAFEYSVIVDEGLRGQGIGSGMMDAAKQFLKDTCDAMMVYRGDELTSGYRFYAKNGHIDVTYLRHRRLDVPLEKRSSAGIGTMEDLIEIEADVLRVFRSAYDSCGGYPERYPGYWTDAANSIIYQENAYEPFKFLHLHDSKGRLAGYAIAGYEIRNNEYAILELATHKGNLRLARELIIAVCGLAARRKCSVDTFCQDTSQYASVYDRMSFSRLARSKNCEMIMAFPLRPDKMARAACKPSAALRDVRVVAWTPTQSVALNDPESPKRTIILEMKDDMFTRLLLRRVDVTSAVGQELITAIGASAKDIRAIASSLPYTRWEYFPIDYI